MPRKVYFSFHYRDVEEFRANVVRNSWKFRKGDNVFHDASIWEESAEKSVLKIKRLIDKELVGTSVSCILIGDQTFSRRFVRYEIVKSFSEGKGQLGVGINWIKDKYGKTKWFPGEDPFNYLRFIINEKNILFEEKKEDRWIRYKDLPEIPNIFFSEEYIGDTYIFSQIYKTYSYVWNDGYKHLEEWIELAAKRAGR